MQKFTTHHSLSLAGAGICCCPGRWRLGSNCVQHCCCPLADMTCKSSVLLCHPLTEMQQPYLLGFTQRGEHMPAIRLWSPVLLNSHVLARFTSHTGRLQRGVRRDDRVSPARCTEMRAQLHSLDLPAGGFLPTGRHDIIKLHYTDHQVHTTFLSGVVVDFKQNYGLSDRRGWRDVTVGCCQPRDM